ncbi:MAG: hypothetical protein Q4E60_10755 [Bacteroidales bacterium]|nr:hypothetical protein [Bacteroidales bacterium]
MEKENLTTDDGRQTTDVLETVVSPEPRSPTKLEEEPDFRPHGYEWFE